MNAVDLIIVLLAIGFALSGYLQGFVVSLLSFVGFVGGALLGLSVAPTVLSGLRPGLGASVLALLLIVIAAALGQGIAAFAGGRIRTRLTWAPARHVDALAGAGLSAVALLVTAWAIGLAVASSSIPGLAAEVRASSVLRGIEGMLPGSGSQVVQAFRDLVDSGSFPDVVAPFVPEEIHGVDPPDGGIVHDPEVRAAGASVVKILGRARSCNRGLEGSGFVVAPERVMTNAHVIAGVDRPEVVLRDGSQLRGTVVYADPDVDVAVLYVPGLDLPVLAFDPDADEGEPAAALGFPNNGPFRAGAARVRNSQILLGEDIYGDRGVRRVVVALRGTVSPGNSGGPLVSADGEVYGVIFAASLTDRETGYALAPSEVEDALAAGRTAQARIDTLPCT